MIAYKGFERGLVCRNYQFHMGPNHTEKANCHKNGFHCAEDPLDCLNYYSDMDHSEYCLVDAGGDLDEEEGDSKISCTDLTIMKRLDKERFFLHALAFMMEHPLRKPSSIVVRDKGCVWSGGGYVVVRGVDPVACGSKLGDVLALAKESPDGKSICSAAVITVDGVRFRPGVWYDSDLMAKEDDQ